MQSDQPTAAGNSGPDRGSVYVNAAVVLVTVLVVVALAAFAYIAFKSQYTTDISASRQSNNVTGSPNGDLAGAAVNGIFGTIQFSLSVLSGVIIVFAAIISFVVGRSARQTQEATRIELNELARLYRENLAAVSESIPNTARLAIDKYLGEVNPTNVLEDYKSKLDQLEKEYSHIAPIVENYKEFKKASAELEVDYMGPLLQIMEDDEKRVGGQNASKEERALIQQTLTGVQEGALKRRVTANAAFNAAQSAARHQFNDLAHRLAVLAHWLLPTPMHEARLRRSEYERGDRYSVERIEDVFQIRSQNETNDPARAATIRSEALERVLQLVKESGRGDCEFIINEAWNMCAPWNHLGELIETFEQTIEESKVNGMYVPSYLHGMLARSYAHRGFVGWQESAHLNMDIVLKKLQQESPSSSWYSDSIGLLSMVGVADNSTDLEQRASPT